jgi:intracellular multiplication protein IcmO
MSTVIGVHGVEVNEDLNKSLLQREVRPLTMRVMDSLRNTGGLWMLLMAILPLTMPALNELWVLIGGMVFMITSKRAKPWALEQPKRNIKTFTGKEKVVGSGIFPVGYDLAGGKRRHLWLSDDAVRTHFLILGSTGSGKTRYLISLTYLALLVGSGALYVDGKADIESFWLLFDLMRRLRREKDLLLMSFLTGGRESVHLRNMRRRLSNTNNFMAMGATEELAETVSGLMRDVSGDAEMWKGRARVLVYNVMRALVSLRNKKKLSLNIREFTSWLTLPRILELANRDDVTEDTRAGLKTYLNDLPGMTMNAIESQDHSSEKANEQNQYLQMQLTEILGELNNTYGHIFNPIVGEINMRDVIYNRRVLFVMLPALAKTPDALAGLGRLVISQVRAALTPALGADVEGERKYLVDARPSGALVPFLMILDEYGYYAIRGFAAVAAQARGIGIWVCYGAQDIPSLQMNEGAKAEYRSILANTNFSVAMKCEEPEETAEYFRRRAGQANVARTEGSEYRQGSTFDGYRDRGNVGISEKDRINGRDLAAQEKGGAHFIYGDKLFRGQTLFFDGEKSPEARLNQFLPVFPPKISRAKQYKTMYQRLGDLFSGQVAPDPSKAPELPSHLINLVLDIRASRMQQNTMIKSSVIGIGMIGVRLKRATGDFGAPKASGPTHANQILKGLAGTGTGKSAHESALQKSSSKAVAAANLFDDKKTPITKNTTAAPHPTSQFTEDTESEREKRKQQARQQAILAKKSVKASGDSDEDTGKETSGSSGGGMNFKSAFQSAVRAVTNGKVSELDVSNLSDPKNHLKTNAKSMGLSDEASEKDAQRSLERLSKSHDYPEKPIPEKRAPEVVRSEAQRLQNKLKGLDRLR